MSETTWNEARRIFGEALERPVDERMAFVARACTGRDEMRDQVECLLRAHGRAGDFLGASTEPNQEDMETTDASTGATPGTIIDRFKLLQLIGEGGFGSVWMAEQFEPVKRRVALKVIKLGMDTKQVIARFEAERQALAMMDHPNIAKVFDAGTTETGRPYFVMELVHGVPITEYCDAERLTTPDRLELFVDVCRAVQHAHQKGVIHRDLKPTNVMVTLHDDRPVPKVIDFGIAKATNRDLTDKTLFTEFRQLVGTPTYMSPEQAVMSGVDIDTRSDIYSLGVLLYELLTGSAPFDADRLKQAALDEIQRIIREEEPARPSTRMSTQSTPGMLRQQADIDRIARHRRTDPERLARDLRGDLDWIVMKALEKERSRRYETATGLADDIRRHLGDEPVLAGPPSVMYRSRKFARRHRAALASLALILTTSIVAAVVSVSFAIQTDRARRSAEMSSRQAIELAEAGQIALNTIAAALTEVEGEVIQVGTVTEDPSLLTEFGSAAADRIRKIDEAERTTRGIARVAFVTAFNRLYLNEIKGEAALRLVDGIMAQLDPMFVDDAELELLVTAEAARVSELAGDYQSTAERLRRVLELSRQQYGADDMRVVGTEWEFALILLRLGRLDEAEALCGHADEIMRSNGLGSAEPLRVAILLHRERYEEAEIILLDALEQLVESGAHEQMIVGKRLELARVYRKWGQPERVAEVFADGLPDLPSVDDSTPIMMALIAAETALAYRDVGRYEEAEPVLRSAYESVVRQMDADHPRAIEVVDWLAELHDSWGKPEEAAEWRARRGSS